ncbi:MAG TPA: flagellar basal body rod protein FlgC [Candidatus Acidoferrales bacterium]|nr:flagellar basal body rod protein FlgC [Candidatus Acidoferrales bacterium]
MKIGKIFSAIDISASGLALQRKKMDAIASNLANVDSVGPDGKPYQRQEVLAVPGKSVPFADELKNQLIPLVTSDQSHIASLPDNFVGRDYTVREVEGKVVQDSSATKTVYDPSNPNADKDGYVTEPKVNVVTEMVDMIATTRTYEANVTAIDASKNIIKDSLDI